MLNERIYLKGLAECLSRTEKVLNIDIDKTMYYIKAIGVKSFRMWMMYDELLYDYNVLNPDVVKEYHQYLSKLKQAGVEKVIGMAYQWYYPNHVKHDGMSIPDRNLAPGSDYMVFMNMFEEMWFTLASEFTEIQIWETGNELNHTPFNHPLEHHQTGLTFPAQTRADTMCDMMYRAKRAVKRANPDALVVMPALAPIEIINESPNLAEFMELMYSSIVNGRYESTDPDDYFDVLAWHPYPHNKAPSEEWLEYQWRIYNISLKYEKKPKAVYFTEVGWTDFGNADADKEQARYYKQLFDLVSNRLPFVEILMYFRLYEDTPLAEWGGISEIYFGMFTEPQNGLRAKAKAFALQEIFGGTGDLRRFESLQP